MLVIQTQAIPIREVTSYGLNGTMSLRKIALLLRSSGFIASSKVLSGSADRKITFLRGNDSVVVLAVGGDPLSIEPRQISYRGQTVTLGDTESKMMKCLGRPDSSYVKLTGMVYHFEDRDEMTFVEVEVRKGRVAYLKINPT